jgi:hypothetical protein
MQFLVYAIIASSLSFEYLGAEKYAPTFIAYTQEICAMVAALVVVVAGVQQRFGNVAARYWFLFGSLLVTVLCGLLTNVVEPGPIFAGLRSYLRAMPFFFLPAVVLFSTRQLKAQFLLVLAFAIAQLPISLDQRLSTFEAGFLSGDRTVGTLSDSAFLSTFLICVASVLFALTVRKRLSRKWAFVLLPIVLAPTMYNETKASLLLVPIALIAVVVVGATKNRTRRFLVATIGTALFVGAFVPIYDYFMKPRYGYGIIEFITMENRVANYLDQNAQVGTYKAVGKVDAITVPLQVLSRDPPQLAFGLGIGNVSDSALGVQFSGEHFQRYGHFVQSGLALLLWETGLLGTGLLLALMLMLFIDAYHLSRRDDFIGAVALGMLGAITVVTLSLPYTVGMDSPALSYLFWYTAGIVAAERCRALAEAPAETRPARPVGAGLTHRPA